MRLSLRCACYLITCNLFAYKCHAYIDVRYMWLFSKLDDTS